MPKFIRPGLPVKIQLSKVDLESISNKPVKTVKSIPPKSESSKEKSSEKKK